MCKKAYKPDLVTDPTRYLVVEGTINAGTDSTFIKLSRLTNLTDYRKTVAEKAAVVTVEDDQSAIYPLKEISDGRYASAALNLSTARKYHIRIKTTDGLVFTSDYETPLITPPIDSVAFAIKTNGVQVSVNTHDPNNNTHYYRWEYEEWWRFHTFYESLYESNGIAIVPRTHQIYMCYAKAFSSDINITSNIKLSKDIITNQPVVFIAPDDERLTYRYTILVRQYALSQKEYEFWTNIKTNNYLLGQLFTAQPSAPTGNVHCVTDPTIQAVGFVGVTATSTQRIFIDRLQLPGQWPTAQYKLVCEPAVQYFFDNPVTHHDDVAENLILPNSPVIPIDRFPYEGTTKGYTGAVGECIDCRLRGNVNPPPFWK